MKIKIKTLWGWRKSEDFPELMVAWDDYCVDANDEGWREDCARAIRSWGDDLYIHRYMDLEIDGADVLRAFDPPVASAQVVE